MSGEPTRRTPSGNTLRLVGADGTPAERDDPAPQAQEVEAPDEAGIVLPVERQSVGIGRHWVVKVAAEAGVTGMANQVVELLSSELLANAVLHGGEREAIGLRILCCEEVVRISVSDGAPESPVVLHPGPVEVSGRGMAIVEAMSNRWSVDQHADGGKTVWFEIDLADY